MTASMAVFASLPGQGVAGEHHAADVVGLFVVVGVGFAGQEEPLSCCYVSTGPSQSSEVAVEVAAAALDIGAAHLDAAVGAAAAWIAAAPAAPSELFVLGLPVLRSTAVVVEDLAVVDLSSCL